MKLKGFSVLFNLLFSPKFCWLRPNYAEQHLSNEKIADIWLWVCRLVHKQRTNWWEVCLRLLRGLGPIMVPHTSISVTSHMDHNVAESIRGRFCHRNGSYKTLFLLILQKITKIWISKSIFYVKNQRCPISEELAHPVFSKYNGVLSVYWFLAKNLAS